jgi:hypothetical protein
VPVYQVFCGAGISGVLSNRIGSVALLVVIA